MQFWNIINKVLAIKYHFFENEVVEIGAKSDLWLYKDNQTFENLFMAIAGQTLPPVLLNIIKSFSKINTQSQGRTNHQPHNCSFKID